MNSLEDWIQHLVEMPLEEISSKYSEYDAALRELESLPFLLESREHASKSYSSFLEHREQMMRWGAVSEEVLEALHRKIRGDSCEGTIWDGVLWFLSHPLPMAMAHDLIDRRISTNALGITRQVDEVQWRLATFDSDALCTLFTEWYMEPQYSVAHFENMLVLYSRRVTDEAILYILSCKPNPSPEKKAALKGVIIREKRHWRKWEHQRKSIEEFLRREFPHDQF